MTRRRKRSKNDHSKEFLESSLFRFGSRFLLGFIVVLIFLTLVQCTVKKPQSPEWTTHLTVPLINRTYPMSEIIWRMDQEGLEMDEDSNVIYTITEEIDTARFDQNDLSTSDIDTTISQQIGLIEVDPPSIAPMTVDFSDIGELPVGFIPDTSFTVINDMPQITTFSSVDIASGEAYVVVTNNLGIDLDTLIIRLYDITNPGSPVLITSDSFPTGVNDGVTDSVQIVLNGKTLSNTLRISAACHTPGGMVPDPSSKDITTAIHFNNPLSVSGATNAQVLAKTVIDTTQVRLGDPGETDAVHRATLSGGDVQLTINNNTGIDANLTISFPDLQQSGQPLVIQRQVNAHSFQLVNLDVSTYELVPTDQTPPQQLDIIVSAETIAGRVDIDHTQDFSVHATVSSVTFYSVTGIFSSTGATIDSTRHEIDIPEGFEGFELTTAILTLRIKNTAQIAGSLSVRLVGDNGKILNVTGPVAAGTGDSAVTTIIVHDSAGSFLSPIPSLVDITGSVSFGDGVTVSTITADDWIHATVDIMAPLEMIITETTIESDIESEDIDVEDIDIITEHVEQVNFIYDVQNSLPIGITANIYISQSSNLSAATYDLDITGLSVTAAPHEGGLATGFSSNLDTVLLSNDDVQILNTDSLYILTEFVLAGSDGQVVRLTSDNAITITGRLEVEYYFDGEF